MARWQRKGACEQRHGAALRSGAHHPEVERTLSWWVSWKMTLRWVRRVALLCEGRAVETATFQQALMAFAEVHGTREYPEPDPQELHYLEFLACRYIFTVLCCRDSCPPLPVLRLVWWAVWAGGKRPVRGFYPLNLPVRSLLMLLNSHK